MLLQAQTLYIVTTQGTVHTLDDIIRSVWKNWKHNVYGRIEIQ